MTSQQIQKDLVEELSKYRVEVSKLRNTLNETDNEKESFFRKKEELSKTVRESIQQVKDKRSKRDSLTNEVKELKIKRSAINQNVAAEFKELDKLKEDKKEFFKSIGIKEPPSKIKQSIKKLEFKIETEPMPFDKEQALMKRIKELKKLYEESKIIIEIDEKTKKLSDGIDKAKKEANDVHKIIQEKAQQSQIMHEEIIKLSADIDKMKAEEEEAFKKFSELKKQFIDNNNQLKKELKDMNSVKEALDKISEERREKRRQQEDSLLKSKEEAVNEKLKRGEKLTTEDLLVFQKFERKKY